jgi:hypothetical protein
MNLSNTKLVKYEKLIECVSIIGFKYEIGIIESDSIITIYPLHTDLGYEFPIKDNNIDWEAYTENAALIPNDIKEKATYLISKV